MPVLLLLALGAAAACGDDSTSSGSATESGSSTTTDAPTATATTSAGSESNSDSQTTTDGGSASDSQTSGTTTETTTTGATATSGTTTSGGETTGTTDTTGTTGMMPLVCPEIADPGFPGEADPECKTEVQVGLFQPTVEWTKKTWAVNPGSVHVGATPIVASMNDDNNDGAIDDDDIPDIIVTTFSPPTLRVVSGADGSELVNATPAGLGSQAGVAVGDIDGDGLPEILVMSNDRLNALEHDGAAKWTSAAYPSTDIGSTGHTWPAISDMDNDGDPEIILGRVILNHDGTLQGKGAFGKGSSIGVEAFSFAVDLDDDGVQEVVVGNALYDPTGATIWTNGQSDGYPAVGDFNDDGVPEIVVVAAGTLRLQSSVDGSILWTTAIPGANNRGGAPTIADFDGDGAPEIGVAGALFYVVFDGDGSILWQKSVQDASSAVTGSSVYDFEGDGVADVVYADETALWVFSGLDGAVKLKFTEHTSGTWFEYPVIVDVDGDDQVEIVFGNQGAQTGLTVIGDAQQSWRPGRKIWNQYDYHITNINDDGTVPQNAEQNWKSYNNFRSGDLSPNDGQAAPDLVLGSEAVCEAECSDGILVVTLHVGNEGASALTAGATLEVIVVVGGVEMAIQSVDLPDVLAEGTWADGLLFELDPAGVEQVIFRITTNEEECNTDNNELVVAGPFCDG